MRLSAFTAAADTTYLDESYAGLNRQSHDDWEWVVSLYGGAYDWKPPVEDQRVSTVCGAVSAAAAKRAACEQASGDVLVEVGVGDVLASPCLAQLARAFADHPSAIFVYSDFALMNLDGSANRDRPDEPLGWVYDDVLVGRRWFSRARAFEPLPHNVAWDRYAPRHGRAFSRAAYDHVGGHDESTAPVEDLDLVQRLFCAGDFAHVPQCLYLRRSRTGRELSHTLADGAPPDLYTGRIVEMAKAWSRRRGFGGGTLFGPGLTAAVADPDMQPAVIDPHRPAIDARNGSLGVLIAPDLVDRMTDVNALFEECSRVLAHGGLLLAEAEVPEDRAAQLESGEWVGRSFSDFLGVQASRADSLRIGHLGVASAEGEQRVHACLFAVKDGAWLGGLGAPLGRR